MQETCFRLFNFAYQACDVNDTNSNGHLVSCKEMLEGTVEPLMEMHPLMDLEKFQIFKTHNNDVTKRIH
jgi:hypothetical protein